MVSVTCYPIAVHHQNGDTFCGGPRAIIERVWAAALRAASKLELLG